MGLAPPGWIPPGTPSSVQVTMDPPPPVASSDLNIPVHLTDDTGVTYKHKLVTIGDSLTQGFQSGAIFNTSLSWPALVARAGGYDSTFLRPHYAKFGGLPLNIEYLIRELEDRYGDRIHGLTVARAAFTINDRLADICHYWQDGDGAVVPKVADIHQNLAVFGYDLRDALSLDPKYIWKTIGQTRRAHHLPMVSHPRLRAALRTLPYYDPEHPDAWPSMSAVQAAQQLGKDGIETLVVFLGSNNVLHTTMDLKLDWSDTGFDELGTKDAFNIWQPHHFAQEFLLVEAAVRAVGARHVLWGTIPHVTIVPLLHGIDGKIRRHDGTNSRYFPYYTRPWIDEEAFDPNNDPHLTDKDVRVVDSAIDQYNQNIVSVVERARRDGLDWRVLDVCTLLDRLARRRYISDPTARPSWWDAVGGQYRLPPALAALHPAFDGQFFLAEPSSDGTGRRVQGGLFALDGVHPTTVGYGLMAQEVINVMRAAGIEGVAGPLEDIDFEWLLTQDSLMSLPPSGLHSDFHLAGWLDRKVNHIKHLFG